MSHELKILAELAEYTDDCTSVGWHYTLYADGHLSAEWVTSWQGHRVGERYITDPGVVDVSALSDDEDHDALAALTSLADRADPREDDIWRKVRNGRVIR